MSNPSMRDTINLIEATAPRAQAIPTVTTFAFVVPMYDLDIEDNIYIPTASPDAVLCDVYEWNGKGYKKMASFDTLGEARAFAKQRHEQIKQRYLKKFPGLNL